MKIWRQWICSGLLAFGLTALAHAQTPAPAYGRRGTSPRLWAVAMARAQTSAPPLLSSEAVRPIGVVTAIDAATKQITIKTDAGPELTVLWQDETTFLRAPPGERDLKNAMKIAVTDIGVGDRILARGRVSDDQKSITATSVIVMTKADIAKKHEADRAEWQRRGVAGTVTSVNPSAKEIAISTPSREGPKTLTITLASNAVLRRYAPDSVKFSDARPSAFVELEVGDEVRALGNKSEDGSRFTAEQLVSGSFRNIAATVVSVDPKQNTIRITDLSTKRALLVRINADSNLRKLPPFVAQMMAMRRAGGGADGGPPGRPPAGGAASRMVQGAMVQGEHSRSPAEAGGPAGERARWPSGGGMGPGGAGGGMAARGGAPDIQQILERMPAVTLADLKPGDAVIVASTVGADPAQVTAITLLAGVEPLLAATPEGDRQMMLGAWNLDMNMNMSLP